MNTLFLKTPFFYLTLLELAVAITVLGLVAAVNINFKGNIAKIQTIDATIFGYVIMQSFALIGFFIDQPNRKFMRLMINVVGICLWLTSSILLFEYISHSNDRSVTERVTGAAVLALICTIIYAFDLYVTYTKTMELKQ